MEVAYLYTKQRSDFGKQLRFEDAEPRILASIASTPDLADEYVKRNPCNANLDTSPYMSQHDANTDRLVVHSVSIRHQEGGWPKDVDASEPTDVNRYRKRVEKDEDYKVTMKALGPVIARCMRQNNTIDIYEDYFDDDERDWSGEPPSAKGLAVFRDPNAVKRTATSINWHPEGPTKIAVSYSILNFQDQRFANARLPVQSYIWDIVNPNTPDTELTPPSPLCCVRFNPKSTDTLVGGSYNGLVTFYDLRRAQHHGSPVESSVIEKSHHDPIYDIFWVSSKTGNQCASVSTDGQMLWWDIRKLGEPVDQLLLDSDAKGGGMVLGGSSMEYNKEIPTKYLVGTEQGVVLSINLRNRKQNNGITVYDAGAGKHHGPIYSIQRNPTHNKFFLTVGDWTARIWMEDLKTPIMTTKYHSAYLTAGCWSPTRAGVFYVTRMDGVVDIWDYFYRQNEVAYSHKVGDAPLSSIAVSNGSGRLVAVGDAHGTVSLLEVCESLAAPQANEKGAIASMLDRETKQEKNLELRDRDLRRAKALEVEAKKKESVDEKEKKDAKMEEQLRTVDANFLNMIKEAEDDESKVEGVTLEEAN
ncbi:WD40-repeat-containing domain protein [Pelagophyceae sp. CCMP2097]|nr:WD40-repeat-containing domain protein [Pelagophyceae sp. CCMP2097]|mmetsp:Transcript_9137/g.30207  ORF Transcript_9137/g.30207 Transcript_9137/m.30207 type:complete len:585 (-) Transcript_9137:127-1881(-)